MVAFFTRSSMLSGIYVQLYDDLRMYIPDERLIHDELRTVAFGTDASFYRLIPKLVVKVNDESEVIKTLELCNKYNTPATFRAAGTSLSGQAISDSILIYLGHTWNKFKILEDGNRIKLQPGIIGAHANVYLAPYGRKIGPDPASINAATIGGIAANNASGMCCGVAQNSYKTLAGMKIIFADGTILDTDDLDSRESFLRSHKTLCERLGALAGRVKENKQLAARIADKFKMKNTTGYSLNALIDYDDPIEIIQHLMIGSEGTLGFIAEVTYQTVVEHPHKASSLMFFPDIKTACEAAIILKEQRVDAVELMDRASLRSVENKKGMPAYLKELDNSVACLLVETRAGDKDSLDRNIDEITKSVEPLRKVRPVEFTADPAEYTKYWDIRKGLFPALGIIRRIGTSVIIEDVAFPIAKLADAALELQGLFIKHGYDEAIIFGHALEGNLHFVFNQDFNSPDEVVRYRYFMNDVTRMVVHGYDGALKAEHGTGRNMAPFVEMEWGSEAYELMKEIKDIFDPGNLLNPGVILNNDPLIYLKNLKPIPPAHEIIDKCIECGFCEVHCPSKDLTLTPRQRIVAWREIMRLTKEAADPNLIMRLRRIYEYQGNDTCAVDGMCATSCPVDIDTGQLTKVLRQQNISPTADSIASLIADKMGSSLTALRFGMNAADALHALLGTETMSSITGTFRKMSGGLIPQWTQYTPRAADPMTLNGYTVGIAGSVVYIPSCVSRLMGVYRQSTDRRSQIRVMESLLAKAGYGIIYPENITELCCGLAFSSKGYMKQAERKSREMEAALLRASGEGEIPIIMDTSPCVQKMKELFDPALKILDPAVFVLEHLKDKLTFIKAERSVTVHVPCSSLKLGLEEKIKEVACMCAENVIIPPFIKCCGFAGDRGFLHPELTESSLNNLRESLPAHVVDGYSTSRGCEIGLSVVSGRQYKSLLYLVDEATG
jgi:D-lactate dehydrogenase